MNDGSGSDHSSIIGGLILFVVVIVVWNWYNGRKRGMSLLQDCNIPGPKPNFWTGNLKECFSMPNVLYDSHLFQKYGPICGYYMGAKPIILITDPVLCKRIEVEEGMKNYRNRPRRVPGGINPDPKRKEMLGNLPADEWHSTRKILSKAFTPMKLRETISQIQGKISIFHTKIQKSLERNPKEIDFYQLFQSLTLDIIGETGFGVDCNIQENVHDPLHRAVKEEFAKSPNSTLVKIYLCFPELSWILQPFRIAWQRIKEWIGISESSELWDQGFRAFEQRLRGAPRQDLLQQLVDSNLRSNPLRVVANSVLFFEAAYETLSSSMGFIVHLLVNHGEVQRKVGEELMNVLGEDQDRQLQYDDLDKLQYMERVIKEGLRLYPPQTTFIGRFGDKDMTYKSDKGINYLIPANVHIQVGLYQLHNSEEYWENPGEFNPDRFLDRGGHDSLTWQAFGAGARLCIGKQFAMIVLKLVLGSLLSRYELKFSPNSEKVITIKYKIATMTPAKGSFAFPFPLHKTLQVLENDE